MSFLFHLSFVPALLRSLSSIYICHACTAIFSSHLVPCSPELISVMLQVGNKVSQDLWEARKPRSRPIYSSSREERERFIKAKYVDKDFLQDLPKTDKSIAEVSEGREGEGGRERQDEQEKRDMSPLTGCEGYACTCVIINKGLC